MNSDWMRRRSSRCFKTVTREGGWAAGNPAVWRGVGPATRDYRHVSPTIRDSWIAALPHHGEEVVRGHAILPCLVVTGSLSQALLWHLARQAVLTVQTLP